MNKIDQAILKGVREKGDFETYASIAKQINIEFGTVHTKDSVRSVWRRHGTKTHSPKAKKTYDVEVSSDWKTNVKIEVAGNYMVIGDTHLPFMEEGYLDFLVGVAHKWNVKKVFHIGDFLDLYTLSFFDKEPESDNVLSELLKAKDLAKDFYREFPNVDIVDGNHDRRYFIKAAKNGYAKMFLKTLEEVVEMPDTWGMNHSYIINGTTLLEHGTGTGKNATYDRAVLTSLNCIQGHTHSYGGVTFINDGYKERWAMNVGCGIDQQSYAAKYARDFKFKVTLGCGIVYNGNPIYLSYNNGR